MDVGRAVTYVFQDPAWLKKVLIGGVLLFIPIFGWFVVGGYWVRIIRQVTSGSDLPLPAWDDFGGDFVRGLKVFVASLVWSLPVIVISACIIGPAGALSGSGENGNAAAGSIALVGNCLTWLLSLALGFISPLIITRVAVTDQIGTGLEVGAVIAEARQHPVPLLIALVMGYALGIVAALGLLLCLVGVVFTYFLAYSMLAHLYGQIRRQVGGPAAVEVSAPTA